MYISLSNEIVGLKKALVSKNMPTIFFKQKIKEQGLVNVELVKLKPT
jgi:hypothetical protein